MGHRWAKKSDLDHLCLQCERSLGLLPVMAPFCPVLPPLAGGRAKFQGFFFHVSNTAPKQLSSVSINKYTTFTKTIVLS